MYDRTYGASALSSPDDSIISPSDEKDQLLLPRIDLDKKIDSTLPYTDIRS